MNYKRFSIKKYILLMLLPLMSFSSCQDWLELHPENDIVEQNYWKNSADIEAVVMSCYRYMIDNNYTNRLFYWGELRSDNVALGSVSNSVSNLYNMNILADNDFAKWDIYYRVINYCNTVIYYAPSVMEVDPNLREDELNVYLSEALAIRAFCYFTLVRAFGDVPYITNPSKDDSVDFNEPQSKESDILDQITVDLLKAEGYARNTWASIAESKGRVTKNAVRAILADVLLWKGDYSQCITKCDAIIDDKFGSLTMMASDQFFRQVFYSGNSPESIFELNYTTSYMNSVSSSLFGNSNKSARAQVKASSSLVNNFDKEKDERLGSFVLSEANGRSVFKYEGYSVPEDKEQGVYSWRGASSTANLILYRLAEIYLIKAEAIASMGGDPTEAISCINKVFARSNPAADELSAEDYSSSSEILKLVLEERRKELCFEGKRWFDLIRYARREGDITTYMNLVLTNFSETALISEKLSNIGAWYMPIHQTQFTINKNLYQNEYYSLVLSGN